MINIDGNTNEKKAETGSKNRYASRPYAYKTSFADVDPIDYFVENNPGKAYEDVLKIKLNNKKKHRL